MAVEQPDPDPRMPKLCLSSNAVAKMAIARLQREWAGFWSQKNRSACSIKQTFDNQIEATAASSIANSRLVSIPAVAMRYSDAC